MAYQTIFKRYELKYLITKDQKDEILSVISPYITPDSYGEATVRNIYFDTDSYRLIRHSTERPLYKEKLRIRSYCKTDKDTKVFVELKKKYDSVVYKRRIVMTESEAKEWIGRGSDPPDTQIGREIDYFISYYAPLSPKVLLTYRRQAFYAVNEPDFRITFDEDIFCRSTDISLGSDIYGDRILDENMVLMEMKTAGGIPLWMTRVLSERGIYKTSFSKYGTAYKNLIFKKE
ncbi:MAG: polyphosphate polymerase domain-containing protein [Clostridia bacterium]|nr:polyphosphate polymerase domain-containing protein [Clostridia bacterium]